MEQMKQELLQKANELLKSGQAEQAIEILSLNFGPDHIYVAIGYNALGARQYDAEEWDKAKLSIEQAKIIWEQHKGEESVEVAACANNLGRVYEHLGDYHKGVEYHRKALATRERLLGMENLDTGMSYLSLGAALLSTGEAAEALEKFESGLELYCRIDHGDSPEAEACRSNILLCQKAMQG